MDQSQRALTKYLGLALWLFIISSFLYVQHAYDLSALDISLLLFDLITTTAWGPLLYICIYTLRPLTFFPGSFLTILSGVFFGFWGGVFYTVIGANISASLAYIVGRFLSGDFAIERTRIGKWTKYLTREPFLATLICRLVFLPFDLVNYAGGILRVPFLAYLAATIIGTLLGIVTFVSIGASLDIDELRADGLSTSVIDAEFILLSIAIFLSSLVISKILKKPYNTEESE